MIFLVFSCFFLYSIDMGKEKTSTLSTIIDAQIKEALSQYCKRTGLKIRHVVETALIEQLEDEIDREAFYARKDEELFSLEEVLSKSK